MRDELLVIDGAAKKLEVFTAIAGRPGANEATPAGMIASFDHRHPRTGRRAFTARFDCVKLFGGQIALLFHSLRLNWPSKRSNAAAKTGSTV